MGIIDNLTNALNTWNEKLSEIWQLITQSPENFKGGDIWDVILTINDALKAIGLALLVLFFVAGVIRTCGSFSEIKRPEHALKLFIRFVLAKAVVTYGLDIMMAFFRIVQGIISTAMNAVGTGVQNDIALPEIIRQKITEVGFWDSIPLWAVTLIGSIFIIILSFIMIMSVYGRFFPAVSLRPNHADCACIFGYLGWRRRKHAEYDASKNDDRPLKAYGYVAF